MKTQIQNQNQMTFLKRVLGLVVIAAALSGCQQNKESAGSINTRGFNTGRALATQNLSGVPELNGVVYSEVEYQDDFNDMVRGFLEATMPRDYVGHVSCRARDNTGVYLGGQVVMENGGLLRANSGRMNIGRNSRLLVAVYDYFPNSQPAAIPPVYMQEGIGFVEGNYAYLKFYDEFGEVELEGQFDNNTFEGEFRFQNSRRYDGSAADSESYTMGKFKVPTCSFFRCG